MVAYYQNRRESERQLRETIEQQEHRGTKLEALLDALPEMLFIFDKEGTIIDYHAGKSSDLAMPPELFLHHKLTELFPASLSNLFLGLIGNVIAEGKMASTEYAMDIAGKTQHYETRMSRYDNRLVIALVNNITDRVLTRERLTQSEEKYRSLVDSSDAIVLMIDDQGIILFVNSIAAAFFGISMEEVSGKRLSDILPEKQARAYLDAAGAIIESGTGETYEQTMTSSEGPKWFHTSVQPVRGTDGKVFAVMINANEITAIKKAEQKLLRSERNYRSLFFNAPYAYLILRNGRILECNEATLGFLMERESR